MLAKRSLEARVPHVSGLPIRRGDGRTNEVVPIGYTVDGYEGVDHRLELVEIVLRCVGAWAMTMSGVEIGFIPHLKTDYVTAEDLLALCGDL